MIVSCLQGYVCMLTHVDKTEDQKQREKPPELSTTDESIEGEFSNIILSYI